MGRAPPKPLPHDDARAAVDRALDGDAAAWDELMRVHGHRVVVSLVARGLRPCEAQELGQDAWLRLMEQQRAGRLERLVLPGLAIAQARWLHLDRLRRAESLVPIDAARHVPSPGADDQVLDHVRLGRLLAALDDCKQRDRELFEAAYGPQGPEHRELAKRFGLSLQRTRQILCTVRATLRRALGEE